MRSAQDKQASQENVRLLFCMVKFFADTYTKRYGCGKMGASSVCHVFLWLCMMLRAAFWLTDRLLVVLGMTHVPRKV